MYKATKRKNGMYFEAGIVLCGLILTILAPRWWLVDAGSDDLLYVRQALSFRAGNWLGNFADGGGLKLPGFPFFLALFSLTRLPYYLGVFSIQVGGAFLIRNYFKKCFEGNYHKIVFTFCVLTPAMFGANNSRLLREGFYSALLVLLLGITLHIFLQIKNSPDLNLNNFTLSLISFAIVSTWIAYTREETLVFILFDLLLIASAILIASWNRKGLIFAVKAMILCLAFFSITNFAIKNINEKYYKTPTASFMQSGPLVELIDQWSRVKPLPKNPRILVSVKQRNQVYSQVPSVGAKKETLENYLGWYANASCAQASVCDEIGSSWIFWGIFYSLTVGEGRSNPGDFNQEVNLMTKEIRTFCERDPSNCDSSFRIPTIGSPRNIFPILSTIPIELINSLSQVGNGDPIPASSGNISNAQIFNDLIPIGGPPLNWSVEPIGHGTTSNLAWLICIILVLCNLKTTILQSNKVKPIDELLAPLTFVILILLFRLFVTSIMEVVMGNVSHTNYSLPGNVLAWIFLSQVPLLHSLMKHLRSNVDLRSHEIKGK